MKHKQILFSLCCLLFVLSCVKDDTIMDDKHDVQPLTLSEAQKLYNLFLGNTSLKNAGAKNTPVSPNWDKGNVYEYGDWYAIESPIEFTKNSITYMTESVSEFVMANNNPSLAKQLQRLVMARNKETGDTYAFYMFIIPELDYMQRPGIMDSNTYFSRTEDLDGKILYFDINGNYINGWIYNKGTITYELIAEEDGANLIETKIMGERHCVPYIEIDDLGKAGGVYCFKAQYNGEAVTILHPGFDDFGGVFPIFPFDSGGGTGSGNSVNQSDSKDKKPQERTDCAGSATENAKNAYNLQNANEEIKSIVKSLKEKVVSSLYEHSSTIEFHKNKYSMTDIINNGSDTNNNSPFNTRTVYGIHTHASGSSDHYGPSPNDIYELLKVNSGFKQKVGNEYGLRGFIIYSPDDTEYLITLNDRQVAHEFFLKNGDMFKPYKGINDFADGNIQDEFEKIQKHLKGNGYSKQDSYDYAMSYLLDSNKTGLKLSKKEKGDKSYRETKTNKQSDKNYEPTKCPEL